MEHVAIYEIGGRAEDAAVDGLLGVFGIFGCDADIVRCCQYCIAVQADAFRELHQCLCIRQIGVVPSMGFQEGMRQLVDIVPRLRGCDQKAIG